MEGSDPAVMHAGQASLRLEEKALLRLRMLPCDHLEEKHNFVLGIPTVGWICSWMIARWIVLLGERPGIPCGYNGRRENESL